MEEKLAPMDILRDLTPTEKKMANIISWATQKTYEDKDGYVHVVFKKNTPKKILRAYKNNLDIMLFKTEGDYTVEK